MGLVLLGMSHRSAAIELRERAAVSGAELRSALVALVGTPGVSECCIVSTCNRVELLALTGEPSSEQLLDRFFAVRLGVPEEELEKHAYRLRDREAITHLFRTASGLDSMVVGEAQILGQIKEAYLAARTAGTIGTGLEALFQKTFAVAKRIRSETGIARSAVSVASAAVGMAEQIFGDLKGRSILLLGVGKMSELASRHLTARGASPVLVATRTFGHAMAMAERCGGIAIQFEEVIERLAQVDIVIASTAAPHTVIHRDDVDRAIRSRRNRPLFLIDIAVPRDVDPDVNEIENVYLYNIDDLQAVVSANREGRLREAAAAEEIVERECRSFLKRAKVSEVGPVISALLDRAEAIRAEEVRRVRGKLGPLTTRQEEQIEALTRTLVNKLLHKPIVEIKRSADEPGDGAVDAARRLFDLAEGSGPANRPEPALADGDGEAHEEGSESEGKVNSRP